MKADESVRVNRNSIRLVRCGLLWGSGLLLTVMLGAGAARAAADWEEVERARDRSTSYVLSRRPAEREGTWVYRIVTTLDEAPETVSQAAILILTDDRYVPAGQRRTTLRANDREVLNHLHIEMPLVTDRDVTTRVVIDGAGADRINGLHWQSVDGQGPAPRSDVVRIPWLRGSFAFASAGSDGTEVVYEMEVDLGGRLPAALVRSFMPSQMKAQIRTLRGALADLRAGELRERRTNQS